MASLWLSVLLAVTAFAQDSNPWVDSPNLIRVEHSRIAKIASQAMPSVVAIKARCLKKAPDTSSGDTLGAGFVIHSDGYILTNNHVISDVNDIDVSFLRANGELETHKAKLIGSDTELDLALLKLDGLAPLQYLKLSSASTVDVGDWLIVIGNPQGLNHSVSTGIVSYKERRSIGIPNLDPDLGHIQTDAAINPGNSGGPVLNDLGYVVAIASATRQSDQGLNYAIPIDVAKRVLPDLKKHGRMRRAWIGIDVEMLVLTTSSKTVTGLSITAVSKGSPADRAGLRVNDLITLVGTKTIYEETKFHRTIRAMRPDARLEIEFIRGQKSSKTTVALGTETQVISNPCPPLAR